MVSASVAEAGLAESRTDDGGESRRAAHHECLAEICAQVVGKVDGLQHLLPRLALRSLAQSLSNFSGAHRLSIMSEKFTYDLVGGWAG